MTPAFLLPLALQMAPAQFPPSGTTVAPLALAQPASAQIIETDTQPAPPPDAQAPAAPGETVPELADPLVDPATQPNIPTRLKAAHYPGDPLEGFNRSMFTIHEELDKSIYRPLAMGYQHVLPRPARSGLRNFFRNLSEPVVFLNDLLQLKPERAVRTFVRFTINSTIGIGGLLDVAAAKGIELKHRNNSFGNTLAYYGVHSGPYLFLPLVGPTTLRDLLGGPVDGAVLPVAVGKPFNDWRYEISSAVITGLDLRAESDPELRALFAGAVDPYATLRSVWLQNRAAEISDLHSHRRAPAVPELEDPLRDPASPSADQVNPGAGEREPVPNEVPTGPH